MKRKVEIEEVRKIEEVPMGEFVRLCTSSGKTFPRVYKLEEYDRSEQAYYLQDWTDISKGRYLKKGRLVQVGFTY